MAAVLDLRPGCELCDHDLPPASTEAMICTFECTFCARCARETLHNVCPNCGGGFTPRPIRPAAMLEKRPPSTQRVLKLLDAVKHGTFLARYRDVPPEKR
jgi:hypothetical protein